MTQQQQQEPNILPPSVQAAWDAWADARIINRIDISNEVIREELDALADEVGTVAGQTDRTLFELLGIVKALAGGDDYVRGRVDQVIRDFKAQRGVAHQETVEMTMIEEERTQKISKVVGVINSILAD